MNLFERFWKTVDERRENHGTAAEFEIVLTAVHPPDGVENEAARDLSCVVRRAPRRYPPVVASQPRFSNRPFCMIYTVNSKQDLPEFHQLFEQYVDKNAFVAETFLRLRAHCELPYVLLLGEKSFFLYDAISEELLRWGNDYMALDELFLQPVASGDDVMKFWDSVPRKSFTQRSEEFGRWLDLWKARIGARTSATPAFMQNLMQKVILLFLYDLHFGLEDNDLRLRTNFLDQRASTRRRRSSDNNNANVVVLPFDGVAWLHQASEEVCQHYHIDFLYWTQAESNFFALMNYEARSQFSQFIFDLFLLSHSKFDVQVQTDVFSDPDSRLKLWKFAVTETLNIKRRLLADDINVYEAIAIDLEDSGIGWALQVIEQTLNFWRERCESFAQQLSEQKTLKIQFDMFQHPDLEHARLPLPGNVFETAFSTSVRIYYDFPLEKATLEYLVILRIFDFCRQWRWPLQPLDHVSDIFVRKARIGSVQEM